MQFDYEVVFSSKRKKLTITVERDRSIIVKAPTGTGLDKIQAIIESRKQWLYEKTRHIQKYRPPLHPPGKELVNGESLLYLGQNYRLEVVDTVDHISLVNNCFLVPKNQSKRRGEIFREWYINQAKLVILPRARHYAECLGVSYNQAKITDSKYRWGSCTPKNNVTFNWRLVKAPMFVINYVVIHELTHFLEPNHTPRFWGIIRSQTPHMEKARNWLKVNGSLLDATL
ncbi:M48 family metallopeptidase [Laspinema sp. D1]|uniref:M48 family metallopeptidase n=1 Tax=Laspinema palackyanum D2a TaxID=2953684 RepID=A0ABT2MJS5_9CYAN|nr:M48 family metallopeptidase [Laspinema sp. D2a]